MLLRLTPYHMVLVIAVPLLLWLLLTIVGKTGLGRIAQLEREIAAVEIKAAALQERNQLMAAELALLQSDESQVEFLARYHLGMIKPGEVFVQAPVR